MKKLVFSPNKFEWSKSFEAGRVGEFASSHKVCVVYSLNLRIGHPYFVGVLEQNTVFFSPLPFFSDLPTEAAKSEEETVSEDVSVVSLASDQTQVIWQEKTLKYDFYNWFGHIER